MSVQPPIQWSEIRDHLVRRLMLDREWTLHGEEDLIWQPWLLPVHVGVYEHSQYSDGFPCLAVKAWVRVALVGEEQGLALAAAGNDSCPMATFFYDDGLLVASCGVLLNADGRTNLTLLHTAVLAMATVAHELLDQALAEGGVALALTVEEEPLGCREQPDELLGVFAGDGAPLPRQEDLAPAWGLARPLLGGRMAAMGFEAGFTDPAVDFYDMNGIWVGVALNGDPGKYGPGLDVMGIVSPLMPPQPPAPGFVNDANHLLGNRVYCNTGNIYWMDPGTGWAALQMASYLPWSSLGEFRRDPEDLATAVFNALMQFAQGARTVNAVALGKARVA